MLETRQTSEQLVNEAAVIGGGRPLLILLMAIVWSVANVNAADPLTIEWAFAAGSTNGFNLRFSRPVNPHTATNLANYSFNQSILFYSVTPLYGTNLQEYVFKTSALSGNTMMTINGVEDFSIPSEVVSDEQTGIQLTGGWAESYYYGAVNGGSPILGDTLADLFAETNRFAAAPGSYATGGYPFPGRPDKVQVQRSMESGPGIGSNYGMQLLGELRPPETGNYIFFISAGSQAALYLGTNPDQATGRMICAEPFGSDFRNYLGIMNRTNTDFGNTNFPGIGPDEPVNRSDFAVGTIELTKGAVYWISVIAKFGTGSDHVSVAWQTPSGLPVANGDLPIQRPFFSVYGSGDQSGPVTILQTNVPTGLIMGQSVTNSIIHGGSAPFDYQWFQDRHPIVGATNRVYEIPHVTADMVGAKFSCRVRNYFSEASTDSLETADRPDLEIFMEDDQDFITWPSPFWDFTLQSTMDLGPDAQWNDVPPGELNTSEVRVPIDNSGGQQFYRVVKSLPDQVSP